MNQFFSPTSRSPAVKFSYSSPNHYKSNIFCSPTHSQELSENSQTLRLMTNIIASPKINSRQIEDRKKRWVCNNHEDKENLAKQKEKLLSQSLFLGKNNDKGQKHSQTANTSQAQLLYSDGDDLKMSVGSSFREDNWSKTFSSFDKPNSEKNPGQIFHFSKVRIRSKKSNKNSNKGPQLSDFILGELLGKGSVGRVFLAKHIQTQSYYAIKIIKKTQIQDVNQLIFSIKCHFYLNHPNIAQLYACFNEGENIYLLMQLCVNGNLAKHRRNIRKSEEKDRIMVGVARGLQQMHKYNLRHGDLKLENILITHGFPKITDFDCIFRGSNQEFKQMRRKSKLWGSPVYFSPEMLSSNSFSLADDIWSVGVIMYEINCGSHPFNLKDTEDLSNIMTADFQSLPEGLNPRTTKLIARLLAKNQQQRASIKEVIALEN